MREWDSFNKIDDHIATFTPEERDELAVVEAGTWP
jgi:hypothetical protein